MNFFEAQKEFFGTPEDQIYYAPLPHEIDSLVEKWTHICDFNGESEYKDAKELFLGILEKASYGKNTERIILARRMIRKIKGLAPVELRLFHYNRY